MEKWRIQSCNNLFKILELSSSELETILSNKNQYYRPFELAKRGRKKSVQANQNSRKYKDSRIIHALKKSQGLWKLQTNLYNGYLSPNILFPDCVYGFIKGRSYEDCLYAHIAKDKKRVFVRLDIIHFFDSIRYEDLRQALLYYIDPKCNKSEKQQLLDLICEIVTLDNRIVQGAVTSPLLSNLVFRSLDIRITRYCQQLGICYTRYADDLLFSFEKESILKRNKYPDQSDEKETNKYIDSYINRLIKKIAEIISEKGFKLNYSKTIRGIGKISLNGFIIENEVRLSRKKQHDLNTLLWQFNETHDTDIRNKLAGYRSLYIQMLGYATQHKTKETLIRKINQIEKAIDEINERLP